MNKSIEGYWYSKYSPEYPMPVPNVLTDDETKYVHGLIINKQKLARTLFCKGCSHSRIDKTTLGNVEYQHKNWKWTGDFADHYVLKHKVKPSDAFMKFLLDK